MNDGTGMTGITGMTGMTITGTAIRLTGDKTCEMNPKDLTMQ
jgi:hypothetical protein